MLSFGAVLAVFLWQGHKGLNLSDEGFLWYGAQRAMVGEVPIRDFLAYDPGRYYWSAAIMALWGSNGIIALRAAAGIFQAIGLFVALTLLAPSSTKRNVSYWLLAGITLLVWMFPRHKLFDVSLSIGLVGAVSFFVRRPSTRRYFLTGLLVGLVAVFGRNHGIYGVVGCMGVMANLALRRENRPGLIKGFVSWAIGVVVGYLPVLLILDVVPGFAQAFWESIRLLFEIKATNLALPVPWPWRAPFGRVPPMEVARGFIVGLFFIAIVAFGVLGILWVVWQRRQDKAVSPTLMASALLALPYAHFAYSRADIAHLAQSIFPFLVGVLALLANQPPKIKWPFAALLTTASLVIMLPQHPGWQCDTSQECVSVNVSGNALKIDRGTADDLAILKKLAEQFAPGDRSFIATPFWPGAYAALERKSPMWEIYAILPRSEPFQRAEIERIKAANPGFVLIGDLPLDGRDELRFRNTHSIVDRYIHEHFERLTGYTTNPAYQIYRRKQATP